MLARRLALPPSLPKRRPRLLLRPRSSQFSTTASRDLPRQPAPTAPESAARRRQPSLYHELFPEKAPQREQKQGLVRKIASRRPEDGSSPSVGDGGRHLPQQPGRLPIEPALERYMNPLRPPPANTERGNGRGDGGSDQGRSKVLLLTCASKNLLESDFFRVGPQGGHMAGWASGLVKVVQARSRVNHEPQGQYLLVFESHAAAVAYLEDAKALQTLSRDVLGRDWRRSPETALPRAPIPALGGALTDDDASIVSADLRRYTLLPPSAVLRLTFWTADKPAPGSRRGRRAAGGSSDSAEPDTGVVWDHMDSEEEQSKVLVRLDLRPMTVDAMREAIEADGRDRNLPWKLHQGRESIIPLQASLAGLSVDEGRWGKLGHQAPSGDRQRFARFMLRFAEPTEARRFVRGWHRRELADSQSHNNTAIIVNATALW